MILITGATGFLGRNLCEYLAGQGNCLRALARTSSDTSFLEALGVEVARGDVADAEAVSAAMQGCDYVIHAAAHFRLWGPPPPFIQTNVEGTRHVLEAALAVGVKKFIHISTIIVVGPQQPGVIITEETPCRPYPTDNYALTKYRGERLAHTYVDKGLPLVILRLGALYGPYGHYAFNRLFFEEFLHNWRVQVHQGRHFIFPCYVGDAVWAIEAALKRGQVGQIYNISNQSISHKEANSIVSCLANRSSWRINFPGWMMIEFSRMLEFIALFTRREPFYPKNLEPYVFNDWIVDFSKAQREFGFVPSTFTEGAQQTLDWYRSIGYV
ncbi:MAG TPA: NAD-dependent epimerase/dehydratase family protein [Anaerolineae bacterium]|nr:NAD-dependent epimerase/dehydratase family protein [Anaerolineae bacterium]